VLVRDYMTRRLITLAPETEILKAMHVMDSHDIANAPVVDAEGRLVGILSDRDCIRGVLQATYHSEFAGLVRDFMTSDVVTVSPDEGLVEATRRLIDLPYRLFPVLEDGALVGVISRRDVIAALTREWQWAKR